MSLPPDPSMAGPYGGAAPSPAGPGTIAAGATDKRPSAAGYWIAGTIIVVGSVAALIWFVSGISNLFSAVETYPRFTVPGQITTPLEAERYKIFAEYPGAMQGSAGVFRIGDVNVTDSSGRTIVVSSSFSEETYSWNGHEGRSIAEFTAPTAGNYTIEATGATTPSGSTVRIAIGRGLQPSALVPLFGAAGLGGLAVLGGIVLIVVTAVRRGRAKRRGQVLPAYAGAYGATAPAPGAYGQWGAPPVYPPTYPPAHQAPPAYPPPAAAPVSPPPTAPETPPAAPEVGPTESGPP